MSTVPAKVIVVGDPQLGEMLASCGAVWRVQPTVTTVAGMWDGLESGLLDSDIAAIFFTDGTGSAVDELEMSVASFAPFAPTFVFADASRGPVITGRAVELAPTVQGGDPGAPITLLPITDWHQSLSMIRQALAGSVSWTTPDPAVASAPAVSGPSQVTTQLQAEPQARELSDAAAYHAPHDGDRSMTLLERNPEGIRAIAKPANALPGQMTIASMSSKGGSGKSGTAMLLASTIAKASAAAGQPKRVVLVDLDTRDGQVGSLIGRYMPTALNIRVMPVWDAKTVQQHLVRAPELGIDTLLAPIRPRNADDCGPDFYRQIISVLQTTHDVVILDCSVNYLDPLLGTAFAMSDEILFVTTLAVTSVQGMARALTELFADPADGGLGIPREKVGVVANMVVNNVGMGKDKLLKAALGAPLVGQIPSDQNAFLTATNKTQMESLLTHAKLGPAYFRLARTCLPSYNLAPFTPEMVAAASAAKN